MKGEKYPKYPKYPQISTNLSEEIPGELLLKNALLGDEVEEVFARLGTLHHDDEAVVPFEVVKEADHTFSEILYEFLSLCKGCQFSIS